MIYFTSDTHFNHKNIVTFCGRPFADIQSMNESLIENWNNIVGPEDTVYHLGDVAFGNKSQIQHILSQLNGNIVLIIGNHDRKKNFKNIPIFRSKNFEWGGYNFLLNHRPIFKGGTVDPYNDSDKHLDIDLNDYDYILCGHVHNQWVTKQKNINMSVENWNYSPVSIDKIIEYIEGSCLI